MTYVHVNVPKFVGYLVRVRRAGCRRYTVGGERESKVAAYALLADMMVTGRWKRGEVLALPDSPYYEPSRCVEMVRA